MIELAKQAGVALTPAGSSFPYGDDPRDRNIRLAPTLPASRPRSRPPPDAVATCARLAAAEKLVGYCTSAPSASSPRRTCTCTSPGSMRHATLLELAERDGIRLPDPLVSEWPPQLSAADEKGWFRFQRLYDVARSVLRTEADVRRLVLEAAEDDVRDGGGWLEIQVDPSGYAARFGGITAFTDLVLDAVRCASEQTGLAMAVVIAANRTRHPLDARTLARLAGQYAGRGRGRLRALQRRAARDAPPTSRGAFRIAERAGLRLVPHGGELLGPEHVAHLPRRAARRTGSATASAPAEDPRAAGRGSSRRGVALEVCPVSNVALGVYSDLSSVPLPDAAGGRRDGRPRRRRPAAVRLAAARPVRRDAGRPRPHRRAARRAGPDVGPRAPAPDDVRRTSADRDRRLAGSGRPLTRLELTHSPADPPESF